LGIGDWVLGPSPIPNPQSPIPNPQYQKINYLINYIVLIRKNDIG